ncbi:MAG: DUF1080 domain-containing protein [Candidatus Hydrogenedentes bacterium]|nr:DUF1080 domain-containing protein [Candidatus Hydrogenedentota bacterium]
MIETIIRHMIALTLCLLLVAWVAVAAEEEKTEEKWVSLFNGKNLDGWIPKIAKHESGENFANTFRVEDGILKVSYEGYDKFDNQFGHLFYKDPFSNYRLRVEYRFVGEQVEGGAGWAWRNSGIMIHGQTPQSMAIEQSFPVSIEVQLLGGKESGERTTGNLCTPGTHVVMGGELIKKHCINSSSKTYRGDEWVTAEVEVRGNTITHFINGEEVLTYTDPQLDEADKDAQKLLDASQDKMLTGGTISLQSESHPVEFRKVEILKLDE